ncbi:hypothetical protein AAEU32_14265 [Pseudoalteromonas sp. SSDWG2]|uniref:hypothetical protein n=1 Tax=Pseudoalteromonas sp. SSDWG2 TaxID=3139391 RepID=UPI003BAA839A
MKYLVFITLGMVLNQATLAVAAPAKQCDVNPEIIKASYHQTQAQGEVRRFNLWRFNSAIAHQSVDTGVVEKWQQLKTGQLRPTRYFETYQRGIEYQPGELRSHNQPDWSQKYQLVSDSLLTSSVKQYGHGCNREVRFEHRQGQQSIAIEWLPELDLLKSMTVKEQAPNGLTKVISSLQLRDYQSARHIVEQQFALWDRYQITDYADVGDNESDPFLSKMINQGFVEHGASGFYDSQGHAIGGHHH